MSNTTGVFEVKNLHASVDDKEILRGVDLTVRPGEVHAVMGPNGSGKSTLAQTIAGHPRYEVTEGDILFEGESILELEPDERAQRGIFLAFQYPVGIPGVTLGNFLRSALKAKQGESFKALDARRLILEKMKVLKIDPSFANRYVNEGFSGGEKKRAEILQMAVLQPKFAILDETDSGLDIDALRTVADGVNALLNRDLGVLVITHYQRLLNYIKPHFVHVMLNGRIVRSGGPELALELEEKGYDWIIKETAETAAAG